MYRCVFHCETCVRDEREKEAGHSLHRGSVVHSHLHRYSDNRTGLKGGKKKNLVVCFVSEADAQRNEFNNSKHFFACRAGCKLTRQT